MSTRMNPYPDRPGQTAGTSDGSRTITIHDVPTGEDGRRGPYQNGNGGGEEEGESNTDAGVLRLRGGGNTRRVVWTNETIDNEGMGKKKSKSECLCLVHR
jgi:protein phosphatase 1 regulatory subunit 11